ncbi:hypothetical protein ACQ4PT_019130 [Festuca glaucescens]
MTALPATVNHYLHKNHELKLVTTPASGVMCDGCKQYGKGSEHYRCAGCNFDLHTHCATGPRTIRLPLFAGGEYTRYTVTGDPACGVCQGKVDGLGYSNELDIFVHPCCAFLPMQVVQDDRMFQLVNDPSVMCGICNKKSQSLSYRTSNDNGEHVCLHVPCLVRINNQITGYQDWHASAPIMPGVRVLLTAAAATKNNGNGAVAVSKKTSTVVSILSLVYHVVTLDPAGIAESLGNLTE